MANSSAPKELSNFSRLKWAFAGCLFCVLLMSGCGAQETQAPTLTPKPKEVELIKDLPYYPDGSEFHLLDLYLPAGKEGPFPTSVNDPRREWKKGRSSSLGSDIRPEGIRCSEYRSPAVAGLQLS